MTELTKLQRFYSFAYTRTWAWLILRFIVVPAYAAVTIVKEHVPEFIAEVRAEWADIEAERKANISSSSTP
jgi:hypothetical protein